MTKYQRFEEEKRRLAEKNLSPIEYQREIVKLCKKLGI